MTIDKFYQANPFGKEFWVEEFGGSGPRVAAYLRVSTSKQAKEGLVSRFKKRGLKLLRRSISHPKSTGLLIPA
ncbi:MAG: hypothetical protein QW175_05995 [Candidatus Bathyarchaeia archaeon]